MKRPAFLMAAALLALCGCDSPSRTVETAREQLAAFQATPDAGKQAAVEKSLDKLDSQIARLAVKGDGAKVEELRSQAADLRTDFQAAKLGRAFNDAKNAIQGIGQAFKEAGKSFSETLKNGRTNEP